MAPVLVVLTIGLAAFLAAGVGVVAPRDDRRVRTVAIAATVLGVWVALAVGLGALGVFKATPDRPVPGIAFGIAFPVIAGSILLARWSPLRTLVARTPVSWLVGVQLYRVVGVVFLIAFLQHDMPGPFALPAAIGDIVVGLTAPLVAVSVARDGRGARPLTIAWCMAGMADLLAAVALGFLTSPSPFQQLALGAPNEAVSRFPFVLVPTFAVPVSILLHVAVLWRLRSGAVEEPVTRAPAAASLTGRSPAAGVGRGQPA